MLKHCQNCGGDVYCICATKPFTSLASLHAADGASEPAATDWEGQYRGACEVLVLREREHAKAISHARAETIAEVRKRLGFLRVSTHRDGLTPTLYERDVYRVLDRLSKGGAK